MKRIHQTFFFLFILTLPSFVLGQKCFDFQKTHCKPPESKFTYTYNEASVSFLFASGERRDIPFRLYDGKDYRMTLCSDSVFGDIIRFSIVIADGKLLYSNEDHQYSQNIEFSSQKTQDVTLRIEAPEATKGVSDTISCQGCIGILIGEMNSIKTGF